MKAYAQKQNQLQQPSSPDIKRLGAKPLAANHAAASRFVYDFSGVPMRPESREADYVPAPALSASAPQLMRACACGGACPTCQTEQPGDEHERLQLRRVESDDSGPLAVPPVVHEVLRSPGQPLDRATRAFMEPRFGHDFSSVRVHSDARAAESAQAVNALAYTVGRHLVFGAGQYSPAASSGRRLLAHELAHSVQQGFAADPSPRLVGDARSGSERQADAAADAVVNNAPLPSAGSIIPTAPVVSTALLQRQKAPHCGKASTWVCGEKGMGTTCEGCGIELESWPEQDPCRKTEKKGTPRTCFCKTVLGKVGTKVAAYKPKRCGEKLEVKDQDSGAVETVTVVDAGPYAEDKSRIIDLHEDVFGKGSQIFNVCVSPAAGKDERLHNCWDGFGGVAPAKPKKKKSQPKKTSELEQPDTDSSMA